MHTTLRRTASLLAGAAVLTATGCLHYQSSTTRETDPGTLLRLQLTAPGAEELTSQLGAHASAVDGRLVTASERGYLLAVSSVTRDGAPITWAGEQILVPHDAIAVTQHRVLDRGRTIAVVGAALAAAIVTGKLAKGAGGGAGTETGGNPSP